MSLPDLSDDPVEVFYDSIASVVPFMDSGLLVEYSQLHGVSVYTERLDRDDVVALLDRTLRALRG